MSPANDVITFRKSRARVRGSTLYRKISSLSLLQVGRGLRSSSLRRISKGGALSLVGFQAQIANRITESPTSKQSQLTGPLFDVEFWTTLKHPTYPTTDPTRPIRRRNNKIHVRASIWCFFSSPTAASTSRLGCESRLTRYCLERVVVRLCMSSWMCVAVIKPPVARKTGNTHASVVLMLRLLAPRFK